MDNKKAAERNFDTWCQMARDDPEGFESMRLAAIEAVIAEAPEANRERLRRLQWRIDQERRLAPTPMAACLRISRMMWQSLLGPNGLNDRFAELQRLLNGQAPGPVRAGRVVAFSRRPD